MIPICSLESNPPAIGYMSSTQSGKMFPIFSVQSDSLAIGKMSSAQSGKMFPISSVKSDSPAIGNMSSVQSDKIFLIGSVKFETTHWTSLYMGCAQCRKLLQVPSRKEYLPFHIEWGHWCLRNTHYCWKKVVMSKQGNHFGSLWSVYLICSLQVETLTWQEALR